MLVQAITISKSLKRPIQVMWTREQEHRTVTNADEQNKIRISLNEKGLPYNGIIKWSIVILLLTEIQNLKSGWINGIGNQTHLKVFHQFII